MFRRPPVLLNRHPEGFQAAIRKWHAHPRALVEGDSWFQYDAVFAINPTPANLFLSTCEYFRCVSLSMSQVGDTVARMLGPSPALEKPGMPIELTPEGARNLSRIADHLKPVNRIDVLFFSGGGNDVVDNLAHLIRPYEANLSAKDALLEDRVEVQMEALRRGYQRLLEVRDRVSPHTALVTHQYGVPNLRKGGFRRLGLNLTKDWIKPQFRRQEYLAPSGPPTEQQLALMTEIVELLMRRFSDMLEQLRADPHNRKFFVAPTRGVLEPSHWRDEMHLTDAGFRCAAKTLRPALHDLFPLWTA